MSKIPLQQFAQISARESGAVRLNQVRGDAALALKRHSGGFLGRAVRWVRDQFRSAATRSANREAGVQASQAFARALGQHFGADAVREATAAGIVQPNKPLLSRDVRRAVGRLSHAHDSELRKASLNADHGRRAGISFLSDLATRDLLSGDATAAFLRDTEFQPGSVAGGVRQALLEGARLPPDKGRALADGLHELVANRDAPAFFAHLQKTNALSDPQVGIFLRHLADTDVAAGVKSLFRLSASGFFAGLAPDFLKPLEVREDGLHLDYEVRTPPLEDFRQEFLKQLTSDALEHPSKSLTPETLAPYVQGEVLDAKAFLDSPPIETQFAKDFPRDVGSARQYEINGKSWNGDPEGALQALWELAGKDSERFSRLGNLLTQNSLLAPLASSIKHVNGSARVEAEAIALLQRNDVRQFSIAAQPDGSLKVDISNVESLPDESRLLVPGFNDEPRLFLSRAPAEAEKRREVSFLLTPQNAVQLEAAELSLRVQAPLTALAYDEDSNG